MKKIIPFFLALFCIAFANAQSVSLIKAEKAFDDKKYEKCIKICDKGVQKDKSVVELYFIKTKAQYALSLITPQADGETNYAKECIKSAIKAKTKDKEHEFTLKYKELFNNIAKQNNKTALEIFNQEKYVKALPYYTKSYELTYDTVAYGMMGICYWFTKNEKEALKIMQKVAQWNFDANEDHLHQSTYLVQAFEILASYYNKRNQIDSSLRFTEMGLTIFPKNLALIRCEKRLIQERLNYIKGNYGLNSEANLWIDRGLTYLKDDTFLLQNQNTFYLTKIGYNCEKRDFAEAAKYHTEFYNAKQNTLSKKVKNKLDEYLIADSMEFSAKCLSYFLSKNAEKSIVYFFYNWYPQFFKSPQIDEKGLETILSNPPSYVTKRLILALMNHGGRTYPKNKNLKTYRLNTFNNWKSQPIFPVEWHGLLATADSVMKDFPKILELKKEKEKLIVRAIDSFYNYKQVDICWGYLRKLKDEFPANQIAPKINYALSRLDFELRYKGSKIANRKTASNTIVAETGWNGLSKRCDYGEMPDSTLKKLENRINYFRQNAGVRDILAVDKERSAKCQEASVMFAPIGVFSREPGPETHTCYTKDAGQAAMFGQMVKDPNPAIALTVLMSDDKSEELYNRQFVLAPNSRKLGIGASENNTVAWVTTPTDKLIDTPYYNTHFIAWPPAFCPKMFLFDKWSFSMYGDFSKAKVTIELISAKNKTPKVISNTLKVEKAPMMPFSTLVITPSITEKEKSEIGEGDTFRISVELNPKKKYSFTSTIWLN